MSTHPMDKNVRRILGIGGRLIFVIGMIWVPVLHRVSISCACVPHVDGECPVHHGQVSNGVARGESHDSDEEHGSSHHHDKSTCAICQLAQTPVETAVVVVVQPRIEPVAVMALLIPLPAEFERPRFLPFSCGPPA